MDFFNVKYRPGYSSSTGDILLGAVCHYFPEYGNTEGTSCLAAIVPSRVGGAAPPRQEQRSSRVWATLYLEFLRQGHWSMGIYLLWMVPRHFRPGTADHFERRHSGSHTKNQPPVQALRYPEDRPQRSKTCAATVVLPLVRELALDSSSYRLGNPTERVFNFS